MSARIGIIGFGFSGLMVLANLVRQTSRALTFYIVEPVEDGWGIAYSTTNPQHVLNVRASNMSAWADAPSHFVDWLASDEGTAAARSLVLPEGYGGSHFVPRMLYGKYLSTIWQRTQNIAAQKKCTIHLVQSATTAIQSWEGCMRICTARGDAIAVDRAVLACGLRMKEIAVEGSAVGLVQHPWEHGALQGAAQWSSPVVLIGTGLTAIDMLLSLRHEGYQGEVLALSRHGWLPLAHANSARSISYSPEEIAAATTPLRALTILRNKMVDSGDWREAIDGLRPHTQALWRSWDTQSQRRFFTHAASLWNSHRHRMAPEIAAKINKEIAQGTFRVIVCPSYALHEKSGELMLHITQKNAAQHFSVSRVINCTGPSLHYMHGGDTLLKQCVAEGVVEPHANARGIALDQHLRAWGMLHPALYAIGALTTGQWLESTAVPELRVQASQIAKDICKT